MLTSRELRPERRPKMRSLRSLMYVGVSGMMIARTAGAQVVDYAAADRIRTFDAMQIGGRVYPVFLSDSARFYYVATGTGQDRGTAYLVDPVAGTRSPVSDTTSLINRRTDGPPWAVRSPDKQWDAFVATSPQHMRYAESGTTSCVTC